jgi:hypothetical protein
MVTPDATSKSDAAAVAADLAAADVDALYVRYVQERLTIAQLVTFHAARHTALAAHVAFAARYSTAARLVSERRFREALAALNELTTGGGGNGETPSVVVDADVDVDAATVGRVGCVPAEPEYDATMSVRELRRIAERLAAQPSLHAGDDDSLYAVHAETK